MTQTKKLNVKKSGGTKETTLVSNVTAIVKAESQILSNALEREDGFTDQYWDNTIEPEINPEKFFSLVEQNNTLGQCVTAMEVNIDGTGYDVVRSDDQEVTEADEKPIQDLKDFFGEVYPTQSLTTCRRLFRRHAEICGYAGLEVIRNPKDDIVFFRPLDSQNLRLMKLGPPVIAKKTMVRGGVEVSFSVQVRERVFVQKINNKKVHFKEFGASRDLNKATGKWNDNGKLPFKERASEIIYFTINKSSKDAYGVPRWLNQLPSVIGSRAAEEINLEYFSAGGIPPLMIFVSGGSMAETAKNNLEALLTGKAKDKLRGLVADIHSSSGTVDKASGVTVQVETFDSARQQDSMFENYDEKCERRVRASFRLPPLFVGKADDYSYASVFASYTLAEAQVFSPERDEFDEVFNATIMRDLTGGKYKIKSKPLTVADATNKIAALELATTHKVITKNQLRDELNKSSDLDIPMSEEDEELTDGTENTDNTEGTKGTTATGDDDTIGNPKNIPVSKTDLSYLGIIADAQVEAMNGKVDDPEELAKSMDSLNDAERSIVLMLASNKIYASTDHDSAGMSELCGCVANH